MATKGSGPRAPGTGRKSSGDKKAVKQPIPIDTATSTNQASSSSINPSATPATQVHPGIEEEIRRRAYELYEERGRQEGFHEEDWARAETEILGRHQRGKTA
jgi:hypothetical protein